MAGTRLQNTMQEGLTSLLQKLGEMKASPDANLEQISLLEQQIVQQLRAPYQQALQQFASAGGVLPGGGGQQAASPGGLPPGLPIPPQRPNTGGGNVPSIQGAQRAMPPVDELRRVLSGGIA